jgi:predicted nicotinamide N-methyase
LLPVADIPGIRLHVADDVTTIWHRSGEQLRDSDPPMPYWAFPWAGGLAVARYLLDHPAEVHERRVLDVGAGSGLCGIVALKAGASSVHALDIDPLAEAAVAVNARANGVRIGFSRRDPLGSAPPECDVILAGDVCYEESMAARMQAWLNAAAQAGIRVLIGDPGRTYLPPGLDRLATYGVRTSREIEAGDARESAVFTIPLTARATAAPALA